MSTGKAREQDDNRIETRDYWTIIALEACGHVAMDIHPSYMESTNGKTSTILIYVFPNVASEDYDAWMRGEAREPFGTIRRVQQSSMQFKNNIQRYCMK